MGFTSALHGVYDVRASVYVGLKSDGESKALSPILSYIIYRLLLDSTPREHVTRPL